MSRTPVIRELHNMRLASSYGGWIYCGHCGKNIGYLCYVTYDRFRLEFTCKCGGSGSMHISFLDECHASLSTSDFIKVKNRLCCPADQSPLFTILDKNLESCRYEVVCNSCNTQFSGNKLYT